MKQRLQKLLASAGICSRRAAETYISAGRVTVNGDVARLGDGADPDADTVDYPYFRFVLEKKITEQFYAFNGDPNQIGG